MINRKLIFSKDTRSETELTALIAEVKSKIGSTAVLLLKGELAAGKTTFIRLFCEACGFQVAQSPTYAIHHRYENSRYKIDHLDLYRIENEEQLETAGLWDLFQLPDNLIFIEWSERLGEASYPLDRTVFELHIIHLENSIRHYSLYLLS